MNDTGLRLLFRSNNFLFLLSGALLYGLGGGIARYLGTLTDWPVFLFGLGWVLSAQISGIYLKAYFDPLDHLTGARPSDKQRRTPPANPIHSRLELLISGATALTITAIFTFLILKGGYGSPALVMILSLAILGIFLYSMPPFRFADNGLGELLISVFVTNLVPMLAYLLQSGDFHRLLAMSTFPLALLYLAMILAFEFQDYASDLAQHRRSLLIQLGWQRGMRLHNSLILGAFLIFALAIGIGLPWLVTWPVFMVLPFGGYQIWQMVQIASGAKPRWRLLKLVAIILMALPAYLLAFSYWMM